MDLFGTQIPILKILQHTSTLIGGILIAFAIYKMPINKIEKEAVNLKFWAVIIALTLIIITARFLTGLEPQQYGNVIVTTISAGLISLTIAPLPTSKKKTRSRHRL